MATLHAHALGMTEDNGRDGPVLSWAVIDHLLRLGWSQSEIARYYGVTRQAVSYWVMKYGGDRPLTPRDLVMKHWPFMVQTKFWLASPCRRLRDHGEYVATRGQGMTYRQVRGLEGFYQKLRDGGLVVEFDPEIPPSAGLAIGGWAYRPRIKKDKDLMIRKNEYTTITEEGEHIWALPDEDPDYTLVFQEG